jgi:hypothetical protein
LSPRKPIAHHLADKGGNSNLMQQSSVRTLTTTAG